MGENLRKLYKLEYPEFVTRACKVSGGTLPKEFSTVIPLTIDYRGCTGEEIAGWAIRTNVIEWQGPARTMTPEFLRKLSKEGVRCHARNCRTYTDPEKRVAEMVTGGMPENVARLAVYEPAKYAAIMADVGANLNK